MLINREHQPVQTDNEAWRFLGQEIHEKLEREQFIGLELENKFYFKWKQSKNALI